MTPRYHLRYFFEWGGPCLWPADPVTEKAFGLGTGENALPLPSSILKRIGDLISWHDRSMNPDYPKDPGPWRQSECDHFNEAADTLLRDIRAELGPDFEVVDQRSKLAEDPDLDLYLKDPKSFKRPVRR